MNRIQRLSKLEAGAESLSERVKAWLGMRPALTPEEKAEKPEATIDALKLSPAMRKWLGL